MPLREQQASMGTTNLQAYARRKKVKKEEPGGGSLDRQDEPVDFRSSKGGHCTADACPADRLLSSEMDVAETLLELSGMSRLHSQRNRVLRWSSKRKRSASSCSRDLVVPSPQRDADLEDALSAIRKNRSGCAFGRDSCISDREEIESARCSKDSVSIFGSRAQSPSSPLPSLQLTSGIFGTGADDVKPAFQAVRPVVPCLLTIKSEVEDIHLELPLKKHIQVSVRPKLKPCKSFTGFKAPLKTESGLSHNERGPEELGVKSTATEGKGPRPGSLSTTKSALSEEEREARRLRRVQANRESARQTILKKQVLCEELRKKAFSLASENEAMRQKQDSLMQELYCLKGQNYRLKQQLEKRCSANLGYDTMTVQETNASDATNRPSSQPAGLPYASVPPPALFWVMAAATSTAAANQAYALHKQDLWAASSNLQDQNSALALSGSEPPFKQPSMPVSLQQNFNVSCSDESSLTATDSPQKEMVNLCASSPVSEGQCDGSSNDTAHSAAKCAVKDSSGNLACDMLSQAGVTLPQPMALNTLRSTTATSKSMESVQHHHVVQEPATGFNHSWSVAGYSNNKPLVLGMKDYAALAAAEARRRRKELTRCKFARSRALKSTAVS